MSRATTREDVRAAPPPPSDTGLQPWPLTIECPQCGEEAGIFCNEERPRPDVGGEWTTRLRQVCIERMAAVLAAAPHPVEGERRETREGPPVGYTMCDRESGLSWRWNGSTWENATSLVPTPPAVGASSVGLRDVGHYARMFNMARADAERWENVAKGLAATVTDLKAQLEAEHARSRGEEKELVRALQEIAGPATSCRDVCRHWGGDRAIGPEHHALRALEAHAARKVGR